MEISPYLKKVVAGQIKVVSGLAKSVAVALAMRLVFVIDRSWSMDEPCGRMNRIEAAKNAIFALLNVREALGVDDQVAVISFNDTAELVLPFVSIHETKRIETAVRSLDPGGCTELKPALKLASKICTCPSGSYVIVLSDGHCGDPIRAAKALKDMGAVIETIGIGNTPADVDEEKLTKIASVQDGKPLYRFLTNADDLIRYFREDLGGRLAKRR